MRLWRRAGTAPTWLEIMLMDASLTGDGSAATAINVDEARELHASLTRLLGACERPVRRSGTDAP